MWAINKNILFIVFTRFIWCASVSGCWLYSSCDRGQVYLTFSVVDFFGIREPKKLLWNDVLKVWVTEGIWGQLIRIQSSLMSCIQMRIGRFRWVWYARIYGDIHGIDIWLILVALTYLSRTELAFRRSVQSLTGMMAINSKRVRDITQFIIRDTSLFDDPGGILERAYH